MPDDEDNMTYQRRFPGTMELRGGIRFIVRPANSYETLSPVSTTKTSWLDGGLLVGARLIIDG